MGRRISLLWIILTASIFHLSAQISFEQDHIVGFELGNYASFSTLPTLLNVNDPLSGPLLFSPGPAYGFSTSIMYKYHLLERYRLGAGIQIISNSLQSSNEVIYDEPISSSPIQDSTFFPASRGSFTTAYFLSFPIFQEFYLKVGKAAFIIGTGFSWDRLLFSKNSDTWRYADGSKESESERFSGGTFLQLNGIGANYYLGFEFKITSQWLFNVNINHRFLQMIKYQYLEGGNRFINHNFGVVVGAYYKIIRKQSE